MFSQALRMTARDWRAGELRFLLVALVVAVSALSSVGFFIDRMRAGLKRDAHQLLGADLLVNADQPLPPAWRAEAQRRGLLLADTVTFPSMAQARRGRAVAGRSWPRSRRSRRAIRCAAAARSPPSRRGRRGARRRRRDAGARHGLGRRQPADWRCNVQGGRSAAAGRQAASRIAQLIAAEPDRGASFANFAPRVMLALDDLAATGLVDNSARA